MWGCPTMACRLTARSGIRFNLFYGEFHISIVIGAIIIILTGMVDDVKEISPKLKLAGQIAAAAVVVIYGGLKVEFINLPFGGIIDFGYLSIPITMIWIIGITNAINLIDGLDGLAGGVSIDCIIFNRRNVYGNG